MNRIKEIIVKKVPFIFLWLSILYTIPVSLSQNEHEFAPIGAEWYFGLKYATSLAEHYNTYYCLKDTIIDSKECKIINSLQSTCNGIYNTVYIYQDSNKVYYRNNSEDFLLLYDFGKTKGESWTIVIKNYDMYNISYDSLLVTVIDVRDTVIGKDTLNFMDVTINNSNRWVGLSGKVYKYIGHEYDLFPFLDGACDMEFNFMLRCYEDSNNSWFYDFDTLHACDYSTVGIINVDNTISMDIYPNPTNDKIMVKCNNIKEIRIYDVVGKEVGKYTINDNNAEIHVNNLCPGVYFIAVKTETGTLTKRFVKE